MKFEDLDLDRVKTIKKGMVFKNRRDLFDYIGAEYVGKGKRSQLQVKKIEILFSYHKEGHKIIVDRPNTIASIELSFKLMGDRQNKISQLLVLDLIISKVEAEDHAIVVNQNMLIQSLALANKNYIYYYYNKNNQIAEEMNIAVDHIKTLENWLKSVRSSLVNAIDGAIKTLEKEGLIIHNKVYKVQTVSQQNKIHITEGVNKFGDKTTDYGSTQSDIASSMRLASNSETNKILAIEQEVLDEMETNKRDLMIRGKYHQFNRACRNKTIEELDIGFYFLCHKFNYAEGFMEKKKQEVIKELQGENVEDLKYELNGIMCERVKRNSDKRIDNHNTTIEDGEHMLGDEFGMMNVDMDIKGNKEKIDSLMKSYERELGREYVGTDEHRKLEEELLQLLLVVDDLEEDLREVKYDVIKNK